MARPGDRGPAVARLHLSQPSGRRQPIPGRPRRGTGRVPRVARRHLDRFQLVHPDAAADAGPGPHLPTDAAFAERDCRGWRRSGEGHQCGNGPHRLRRRFGRHHGRSSVSRPRRAVHPWQRDARGGGRGGRIGRGRAIRNRRPACGRVSGGAAATRPARSRSRLRSRRRRHLSRRHGAGAARGAFRGRRDGRGLWHGCGGLGCRHRGRAGGCGGGRFAGCGGRSHRDGRMDERHPSARFVAGRNQVNRDGDQ